MSGKKKKEKNAKKNTSIAGKWKYSENFGYGTAKGELIIEQEAEQLKGKIIFNENADSSETFMIQEKVEGKIIGDRVEIYAIEFDVIYSDYDISYELDSWIGKLLDENTIAGISRDEQGVEGNFKFTRIK